MRDRKWLLSDSNQEALHHGPFIPCRAPRSARCDLSVLQCAACNAAKTHIRKPSVQRCSPVSKSRTVLDRFTATLEGRQEKVLKRGHTKPGDCISADHYISSVPGRLPNTYGREKEGYQCGTLFVDHASGKVFNYCQFSTSANETLKSKHQLEALAGDDGIQVKAYHSDNGTFASRAYKDDCDVQLQKYTFSGVGAHHQNGVAERNIQTIANWARASMLHAAMHWPA